MPRFSVKTKEIFDEIHYSNNIKNAKNLSEKIKDPLDAAFGKLWISEHLLDSQQLDEFLETITEIEKKNENLKDQFLQILINRLFCMYYVGWNNPLISKEQAKIHLYQIEQSYQNINYKDDWEKYFCLSRYYHIKATYEWKIKNDLSNAIKVQKKCVEVTLKIPNDGEAISARSQYNLGLYYYKIGNFDAAEKWYDRALDVYKKYNLRSIQSMSLVNDYSF